jgi:hypothetical protein
MDLSFILFGFVKSRSFFTLMVVKIFGVIEEFDKWNGDNRVGELMCSKSLLLFFLFIFYFINIKNLPYVLTPNCKSWWICLFLIGRCNFFYIFIRLFILLFLYLYNIHFLFKENHENCLMEINTWMRIKLQR